MDGWEWNGRRARGGDGPFTLAPARTICRPDLTTPADPVPVWNAAAAGVGRNGQQDDDTAQPMAMERGRRSERGSDARRSQPGSVWSMDGRRAPAWSVVSGQWSAGRAKWNGIELEVLSGLKGLRRRQGAWLEVGSLAWFAERLPSNQFSELQATLLRGSPRLGAAARDVRPLGWRRETGAQPGCAQVGAIPQTISTAAKPRMQGPIVCLCTKYCTYSVLSCFLFFCFSASSVSSKPTNMAADALGSAVAVAANSEGFGYQRDPSHSHN